MQDNTQVRSLRAAGADALLLPTYTPVRVDEENVSGQRVLNSVQLLGVLWLESTSPALQHQHSIATMRRLTLCGGLYQSAMVWETDRWL
jgi:hypothetical protein